MKKFFFSVYALFISSTLAAQQNYCNFEGVKFINFGWTLGPLDTLSANPAPDSVNESAYCARYVRDTSLYDNIKIYPYEKLINITPYANNTFQTPKMKMKVFSSAPPGTKIKLHLGPKTDDNYPTGVHSEYVGVTKMQNAWELITFHYLQSPQGSNSTPDNIDKIALFFNPNSNSTDTFYFDDLMGPELLSASVPEAESRFPFRLYQNSPNPAREITHIKFQLNQPGFVSLKLYDMIGNQVASLVDEEMKPGVHSVPFETGKLSEGIYFYTMKKDGISRSMKMIISK